MEGEGILGILVFFLTVSLARCRPGIGASGLAPEMASAGLGDTRRTEGANMPKLKIVALGMGMGMLQELVATTDTDGSRASVWRAKQTSSGDQWAPGWQPLGKPGRGIPQSLSVIQQGFDAHLEAFVIDSKDQALWHSWQTDPDEGWSEWDLLGNPGGSHAQPEVALTILPDIRVMAVVAAGGTVWHVSPPQPEPSSFWPAWSSLGRPGGTAALAAAAASLGDNRIEVVALGKTNSGPMSPIGWSGKVWHRWQTTAGGTDWSGWEPLGMPEGQPVGLPTLAENADRRLELFTTATAGGQVWHRALRASTDPQSWAPWAPLHPAGSQHRIQLFGVARDTTDHRLVLVGTDGYELWHTAQTAPGASTWKPWSSVATVPGPPPQQGFPLSRPVVGFNHAGLMEIFVVIYATGELYHLKATAAGQIPHTGQSWPPP